MAIKYITDTWGRRRAVYVPDATYAGRWLDAVKTCEGTHRIGYLEIVNVIEDANGRGYDLRPMVRCDQFVRVLAENDGGLQMLERLEQRIRDEEFSGEEAMRDRRTGGFRTVKISERQR